MVTLNCNTKVLRHNTERGLFPQQAVKLKFHGIDTDTDTDTDFLADFRARILARKSARRGAAVGVPRRARHADCRGAPRPRYRRSWARAARSARRLVGGFLFDTRSPREEVRWGCTRVHVYVYCA